MRCMPASNLMRCGDGEFAVFPELYIMREAGAVTDDCTGRLKYTHTYIHTCTYIRMLSSVHAMKEYGRWEGSAMLLMTGVCV